MKNGSNIPSDKYVESCASNSGTFKVASQVSCIQLVFRLTNLYCVSWNPKISLDGRKGNHPEIVWLVGRN